MRHYAGITFIYHTIQGICILSTCSYMHVLLWKITFQAYIFVISVYIIISYYFHSEVILCPCSSRSFLYKHLLLLLYAHFCRGQAPGNKRVNESIPNTQSQWHIMQKWFCQQPLETSAIKSRWSFRRFGIILMLDSFTS